MGTNPFQPIETKSLPKAVETNYQKDGDIYVIEYGVKERVKMVGEKDTDFVIEKDVVEISRTKRQDLLDSQSDDVGIMNIIKKVALSGDTSLLNQTKRVGYPGVDTDALGRPVEDVVDITKYQVDRVAAFEAYKKGSALYKSLPDELKGKLSLEGVANLSDEAIDAYVKGMLDVYKSKVDVKPEKGDE